MKKRGEVIQCLGCGKEVYRYPSDLEHKYCSRTCKYDLRRRFVVRESGCWEWTGVLDRKGYGHVSFAGKSTRAHRVMYEQKYGPVPEGLVLDHLCENPKCCNPDHLEPVTNKENCCRGRRIRNARSAKTCPHGHPWTKANTYINLQHGSRVCRACTAKSQREYYQRKRLVA